MLQTKALIFCVFSYSLVLVDSDILCEDEFCRTYGFEVGCTSTSSHCSINNDTHSGIWMQSPTICNCCNYCLPYINENQPCSLGGPGLGTTVGRCGPGLYCTPAEDGNYCKRMESECHSAQDGYDERQASGVAFALEKRPLCDDKGKMAPISCDPISTCFCQSEEGERLFGEFLFTGDHTIQNYMQYCACSRFNHKIRQLIGSELRFPVNSFRCTSNGNFNPVQCINRNCYCVNKVTGKINHGNVINLDEDPISELPCYDPNDDLFPEIGEDPPFNYTSPCFEEQKWKENLIVEMEGDGFIMDFFNEVLQCLPDGTYGRTAITNNHTKICVDEHGHHIDDYEALPGTNDFDNMNCKCAVTSSIMESSLEKPMCCKNGNFRPVQCRRGQCYCVNDDGRQIELEQSDVTTLSCYTDDWKTC